MSRIDRTQVDDHPAGALEDEHSRVAEAQTAARASLDASASARPGIASSGAEPPPMNASESTISPADGGAHLFEAT